MTKVNSIGKRLGATVMACAMAFSMSAFAGATDVSQDTTFDVHFSGYMANMVLTGEKASYDADADTLTIPIKSLETEYDADGDGIAEMCYGSLTGIDLPEQNASGTAEFGASEIVITNFEDAISGSYAAKLTVTVQDEDGEQVYVPQMAELNVTMFLS